MIRRLFSYVTKEISGIHEAAYLLGAFSILSTILALARDRLLAHFFGATHALDIYYAAFRVPDFIFASVGSIVAVSILIPFLMERIEHNAPDTRRFIDGIFSAFFFIIGITAIVAFIFASQLMHIFFPTFVNDFGVLTQMTRIMLLSPIFLGFSNFFGSITQIHRRFFIYAISPVVYNIGIIIGTVVFYPIMGLSGLAWGVALGAFLHFFIQVPFVLHKSFFPRLRLNFDTAAVWKVILISFPRTITVSSNEIAEFFLIVMAGTLAGGAISIFNFSWNLQSVPLGIIGTSYALAAFPLLTKLFTRGENKRFVEQVVATTNHINFWSLPVGVLFIVLRAQIVRVVLGSGAFNWSDTRLTAAALALFVISLIPQSLVPLFVRAYYSRGDTKRPLFMNMISAALIIGFSFTLVKCFYMFPMFRYFIEALLRIDDTPAAVALMLPLGFSFGVLVNMILHWIAFEHDFPGYTRSVARSFFQICSVSILMGAVSYVCLNILSPLLSIGTTLTVFLQGFIAGIIGILFGVGLLVLFKNQEFAGIVAAFKKRFWRVAVIPPDPSGA